MGILRVLLAIAVIITHTSPIFGSRMIGGPLAVEAFFIISGFYMTMILNEKYVNHKSYKLFLTNRFLRIYPVYWVVLIAILLISLFNPNIFLLAYIDYGKYLSFTTISFMILSNLAIIGQDICMFLGIDVKTGSLYFSKNFRLTHPPVHTFLLIKQAWSISLELLFYAIAPFIVRKKASILLMVIFLSFILRIILYYKFNLNNDPWSYRFFFSELAFFLMGSVSYKYYKYIKINTFSKITFVFLSLTTFSLIIFYGFVYTNELLKQFFLLFLITISVPYIFLFTKDLKWDVQIGELSYPIYIVHLAIVTLIEYFSINTFNELGFLTMILSISAAYLLNYFIARRIEDLRRTRYLNANLIR